MIFDYLTDESKSRYNHIKQYLTKSYNDMITNDNNRIGKIMETINLDNYIILKYDNNKYNKIMTQWYRRHNINHIVNLNNVMKISDKTTNIINGNKMVVEIVELFDKIQNRKINKTIYCYPIDVKRNLYNIRKITNNNIQLLHDKLGALTISGETLLDPNIIIITRKEEEGKLLMHELVHLYDLDELIHLNKNIIDNWNVKYTENYYESYAELVSNIMILFYYSNKYNLDINELIEIERIYSVYVCCKLLHIYGYTIDSFFNKPINKITFSIPALYYYIIRSMLFFYIDEIYNRKYIDEKFKATKYYNNVQEKIIKKALDENSEYIKLMEKIMTHMNDIDDSLTYMCIDVKEIMNITYY